MQKRLLISLGSLLVIGVELTVVGCAPIANSEADKEQRAKAAKDMPVVCRDGVEYFSNLVSGGYILTPHLQPNGLPITCGETPSNSTPPAGGS